MKELANEVKENLALLSSDAKVKDMREVHQQMEELNATIAGQTGNLFKGKEELKSTVVDLQTTLNSKGGKMPGKATDKKIAKIEWLVGDLQANMNGTEALSYRELAVVMGSIGEVLEQLDTSKADPARIAQLKENAEIAQGQIEQLETHAGKRRKPIVTQKPKTGPVTDKAKGAISLSGGQILEFGQD
jgi:hypothetical protein